jgi:glutamate/tyrosine decarboxylase-like PLP-dependent enzyme
MDHRLLFERACAHASRHRDGLADRPPWPTATTQDLHRVLGGPTPEVGEDALAIIDDLAAGAERGLSASAGSRFFGWVIGASHPVGVAADMMASAWGQNAGNHVCSPAAAVIERIVGQWLLDILRLPAGSSVGLVTGATMASFVCLAAARNAVLAHAGWDVEADGLAGAPPTRIMLGADAHATIFSALRYLGFGSRAHRIATDDQGRMDPGALAAALSAGKGPAIVIAQAGQINTGAFDPGREIARVCRRHDAWLHVDGAFGLWARAAPELAALTDGLDEADSWSVDGHKWLQTPYDCGFAIVRHPQAHRRAMSVAASYLPPAEDEEYDPAQYVPELSRRARGFAAWAMLRRLGRQGLADMVRRHCAFARELARRVEREPGVQVLNRVELNQVLLAFGEGSAEEQDEATREVIAVLRAANSCLAGGAEWHDRWVLRLSIISAPLEQADIDRLAGSIVTAWRAVRARRAGSRALSIAKVPS